MKAPLAAPPKLAGPGPSQIRPPQPALAANVAQLMPLLQSLQANPAALEKIKTEHPQVYRQLQSQLSEALK